MPKDVGVEKEQNELNIWCKQTNRTKTEQNIDIYIYINIYIYI